jgi:hypothetical protein
MASPLWKYPGVLEGRIQPVYSDLAEGGDYGYGYSGGYAYGYFTDHAWCLGEDVDTERGESYRFLIGDTVSVQQTWTPTVGSKILRLKWQMRTPPGMRASRDIALNKSVSFISGTLPDNVGFILAGDGARGIVVNVMPDSMLQPGDEEGIIAITGATNVNNNGRFTVRAVPAGGLYNDGYAALIDSTVLFHQLNDPNVNLRMLGSVWVGRIYVDDGGGFEEYLSSVEYPNHDFIRTNIAINVSKVIAPITVKFELTLELLA